MWAGPPAGGERDVGLPHSGGAAQLLCWFLGMEQVNTSAPVFSLIFHAGEQSQVKDEEGAGSLCWSPPAVARGWPCDPLPG